MIIKALKTFSDGAISMYKGEIAEVADAKATQFISEGLAVEYSEPISNAELDNITLKKINGLVGTVNTRITGKVNVLDLGAKGDGVTDDTEAIKTALQAGGVVFFPKGVYRVEVGKLFLLPTDNLTIIGDNAKIEFFVADNTAISNVSTIKSDNGCEYLNISGVELSLDVNDGSVFENEIKILHIIGQFKEINIDGVVIHAGGTNEILPKTDCLWAEVGCDYINITNCVVENFTNTAVGGCIWVNPSYKNSVTNDMVYTDIGNVIIKNCEIRGTNHDEAVAVWIRQSDTNKGLHNVMVDSNIIEHKNWNGECTPTANLVCVYSHGTEEFEANVTISNNTIISDKANSAGLIKDYYCNSIVVDNNTIVINGIGKRENNEALDFPNCPIIANTFGDMVFRNNTVKFNVETNLLQFNSQKGNLELSNNKIVSMSSVQINDNDTGMAEGVKKSTIVKNNTINMLGGSGNNRLYISSTRLAEVHRVTRVLSNYINGVFAIDSQTPHAPIEVVGNTFGYIDNSVVNYYYQFKGGEALVWENNKNIVFYCSNSNLITKLDSFKYVGLESGLTIVGNYTPSDFFTSSEIKYTDVGEYDLQLNELYTLLGSATDGQILVADGNGGIKLVNPTT